MKTALPLFSVTVVALHGCATIHCASTESTRVGNIGRNISDGNYYEVTKIIGIDPWRCPAGQMLRVELRPVPAPQKPTAPPPKGAEPSIPAPAAPVLPFVEAT